MKKTKKILLSIAGISVLVIIISFVLWFNLFIDKQIGNRPIDQPFSKWISDDKSIVFTVNEYGEGIGSLILEDKIISIFYITGEGRNIDIYTVKNKEYGTLIEEWRGDFRKPDEFTAKVIETTYFEPGMKIHFKRVDTE